MSAQSETHHLRHQAVVQLILTTAAWGISFPVFKMLLAVQQAVARTLPMRRVGFPEDIKGLALFLASPASAYITGQQISIDGGWTLGRAD